MSAQRRAGAAGQLEAQGRSHEAPECGTYRLLRREAPGVWTVEWTAPCEAGREPSTLRFVAPARYWRNF